MTLTTARQGAPWRSHFFPDLRLTTATPLIEEGDDINIPGAWRPMQNTLRISAEITAQAPCRALPLRIGQHHLSNRRLAPMCGPLSP